MMLAGELTLAGVDVVIVERRTSRELDGSRAGGLHSRTIEVLDQRGIADRFLAEGQAMQVQGYAYIPLDISDFPTRHNYGLGLWQSHFERILAGWVDELGVPILMGREVVGFTQDDAGVDVELSDGSSLPAAYLVGCDGGRSTVRKAAGIEFAGFDPSISFMIAEVDMTEEPQGGLRREGGGIGPVNPQQGGNPYRVVLKEQRVDHAADPTLDDLREALVAADGTDYGVHNPTWISRFTDASRQAASYRAGRVLLAGDAAHIHSPHGPESGVGRWGEDVTSAEVHRHRRNRDAARTQGRHRLRRRRSDRLSRRPVFAAEGAAVHLVGRTRDPLERVAADITDVGGQVEIAQLDATDCCRSRRACRRRRPRCRPDRHRLQRRQQRRRPGHPPLDMARDDVLRPVTKAVTTHLTLATAVARHMIPRRSRGDPGHGRRPRSHPQPRRLPHRLVCSRRPVSPAGQRARPSRDSSRLAALTRLARPLNPPRRRPRGNRNPPPPTTPPRGCRPRRRFPGLRPRPDHDRYRGEHHRRRCHRLSGYAVWPFPMGRCRLLAFAD